MYAEKDTEKRIPRMEGGRGELDMESSRKGQWERRNRRIEGRCRGRGGGDESAGLCSTRVIPLVRESSGNKGNFTMAMGVRISYHQLLKCFELDMQWGGLAETLLARGAADPIPLLCQLGSDCKGCMGSVKSTWSLYGYLEEIFNSCFIKNGIRGEWHREYFNFWNELAISSP